MKPVWEGNNYHVVKKNTPRPLRHVTKERTCWLLTFPNSNEDITALNTFFICPPPGVNPKERCKTPDSPEGARLAQTAAPSPTQSSPIRQPANGSSSPLHNGSADSISPPPHTAGALGTLSLSLGSEVPTGSQWTSHGLQQPHTRSQLTKVKRFLSTLVQFGQDIAPDIGDRVRNLVLSLVVSQFLDFFNYFFFYDFLFAEF